MPGPTTTSRFDDRLSAALALDPERTGASLAIWSQLLDRVAQGGLSPQEESRSLAALALVRGRVAEVARAASARAIAARNRSPALAVLLAGDAASVVRGHFEGLNLPDDDLVRILPEIGPIARDALRRRHDLPREIVHALERFGPADMALPDLREGVGTSAAESAEPQPEAPRTNGTSIAELVRRIERYRGRRQELGDVGASAAPSAQAAFLCDATGLVRQADGPHRARLIGISLMDAASAGSSGVDAGTARAFQRRDVIHRGRLQLPHGGGLWSIEAEPIFAAESGRFAGYRGTFGKISDLPDVPGARPSDRGVAQTVRELMHELRSPLNAISGFAELVALGAQGPIDAQYRLLAERIVEDARTLLEAFEDLDLAARYATNAPQPVQLSEVDLVQSADAASLALPGNDHLTVMADPRELSRLMHRVSELVGRGGPMSSVRVDRDSEHVVVRLPLHSEGESAGSSASDARPVLRFGRDFSQALAALQARAAGGEAAFANGEVVLNFPRAKAPTSAV